MTVNNQGQTLAVIDMPQVLQSEYSYSLGNVLSIGGNADNSISLRQMANNFIGGKYPTKLEFAIGIFCLQGSMKINVNLTEYLLVKNDMLLCPKGVIGQCYEFSDDCRLSSIIINDYNFIPIVNTRQGLVFSQFVSEHNVLHLSSDLMAKIQTIIGYMKDCLSDPSFENKKETISAYTQVYLCLLQNEIQHKINVTEKNAGNRSQQIFANFISDLEKYCTTERSIDFYAARQYISPRHLAAVIKENSKKTATGLIREYVLLEAKALLKIGKYTVQEVSIRLNFANQSFFGTWFKKATGMSPREYQENG